MNFNRLKQSFKDAGSGLKYAFKNEQNFRIHFFISLMVILGIFIFPLLAWEIITLILFIILVLAMELMNTVVEQLSDLLKPRLHQQIFLIKNIMAGAVFLTSVGALMAGIIIFIPHFINFFK